MVDKNDEPNSQFVIAIAAQQIYSYINLLIYCLIIH